MSVNYLHILLSLIPMLSRGISISLRKEIKGYLASLEATVVVTKNPMDDIAVAILKGVILSLIGD